MLLEVLQLGFQSLDLRLARGYNLTDLLDQIFVILGSFLITAAYALQDLQQIGRGCAYGSKFSGADFLRIVVFDKTWATLNTKRDGADGNTQTGHNLIAVLFYPARS
jgi:hypothetical protein